MDKFIVKIYDLGVSEHQINGLDAAKEFVAQSFGRKSEIISQEGLVILSLVPGKGPSSPPPPAPVITPLPTVNPVKSEQVASQPIKTQVKEPQTSVEIKKSAPVAKESAKEPINANIAIADTVSITKSQNEVTKVTELVPLTKIEPAVTNVKVTGSKPVVNVTKTESVPTIENIFSKQSNASLGNTKVSSVTVDSKKKSKQ